MKNDFWIIWSDASDQALIPKKKFSTEQEAYRVAKEILNQRPTLPLWIAYVCTKMTMGSRPILVEDLRAGKVELYEETTVVETPQRIDLTV